MEAKPNRADSGDVKDYRRAYDRWRDKNDPKRLLDTDPTSTLVARLVRCQSESVLEQRVYFQENKPKITNIKGIQSRPLSRRQSSSKSLLCSASNGKSERVRANGARYRADPVIKRRKSLTFSIRMPIARRSMPSGRSFEPKIESFSLLDSGNGTQTQSIGRRLGFGSRISSRTS